ncbi:hypothetical protein E1B28_010560 [Marasmius oreades]|uniref:CxC1-like cysteine cluster associated with KDZ transposases domain-containing protein n=1 Tax=Marasmius oreades TaxID=181124 RepID=A0A9P7USU0_9AGAR|nr:uncharacterized protein E1B28_010560 [Marasmius oreades]KAG7091531.1 hypothetical protein E1B28_010560 [Marasmius oreades]
MIGHGKITRSPGKRRSKARGNKWVEIPGNARKVQAAEARIASLLAASAARRAAKLSASKSRGIQDEDDVKDDGDEHVEVEVVGMAGMDENGGVDNEMDFADFEDNDAFNPSATILDDVKPLKDPTDAGEPRPSAAFRVTTRWKQLLPTLLDSLVLYRDKTIGKLDPLPLQISSGCSTGTCVLREATICCYSFISHQNLTVPYCECWTLPQVLVQHGLFPASPSQPRTAFSIDLLDLYQILWRYSCDAITSFSSSLAMMYRCRGFTLCDQAGSMQHDPIRRPLGTAVQWFDCLQDMLVRKMNHIVEECKLELNIASINTHTPPTPRTHLTLGSYSAPPPFQVLSSDLGCPPSTTSPSTERKPSSVAPTLASLPPQQNPLATGACASVLQRLCPACFGGDRFGLSFDDGGDVHVALDGNLHHR